MAAFVLNVGAPVGKYAARGRRLASDPFLCLHGGFRTAPAGQRGIGDRDGVQQDKAVGVPRVGDHLFGRTLLNHHSKKHHQDPPCPGEVPHYAEVMADKDIGQLLFGPHGQQ